MRECYLSNFDYVFTFITKIRQIFFSYLFAIIEAIALIKPIGEELYLKMTIFD